MNSSNETYYPLDFWFEALGFPKNLEILTVYIIAPLGIMSFLLNLLTFMVLCKKCFLGSIFFSYMKLYIFSGTILSLISSTFFILVTQRLFRFSNTYEAVAYSLYFFSSVQPMFFLYCCFLEICIVIERSFYFLPKRFRKFQNIDFNTFNLILFLFCVILHIPILFLFFPDHMDVQLDNSTSYRIWYIGVADFSNTLPGKLFTYSQYMITGAIPLIVKIILNSILVYLVKSYVNKLKRDKLANAQKVFNLSNDIQNGNFISKTDRNQTFISIIMCVFSIFEHIFYIVSYILYFLNEYSDSNIYFCIATLFIIVKHLFNILILYKFNSLFKSELKKFLNLK